MMQLSRVMTIIVPIAFLLTSCNESGPKGNPSSQAKTLECQTIFSPSGIGKVIGSKEDVVKNSNGLMTLISKNDNPPFGGIPQPVSFVIPEAIELKLRGKLIEVTAVVKTGNESGLQDFAMTYSTNMNGTSGWKKFSTTNRFENFSFLYIVPEEKNLPANLDYIGLNADISGKGGSIIVKELKLGPKDKCL